ncbi:MAG: prohibitin family protein [Proteobacteria bacterium]|jgi:regulator of protease activity HflC (stomatin/prohibitin superfamily)|nr:prohibitin family protein [Pseudomonadota bacterium]
MKILLLIAALLSTIGCTASTESTEVGVRTVNFSLLGGRGVQKEVYPQGGTYFFFRPLSDWQVFDVGLQNLEMMRESAQGDRTGDDSLRFKTIDGNDISVNVTIAWRINAAQAPYVLQFIGRSTKGVEDKFVRPTTRTVVRDVLNKLTSEEYYQADRRFEMAEEARDRLMAVMEQEGIIIEQVLLGEHRFNATYEQIIRDKKVAEQEASRLKSETEAAREEMKRDLEKAKGIVSKSLEEARGMERKRKLAADAFFFEREQQAQAIMAEKTARAEGLTARAKALAGSGGENMVKLKVAEALQGKKIVFIPAGSGLDLRNTDVNALLEVYGVQAAAAK